MIDAGARRKRQHYSYEYWTAMRPHVSFDLCVDTRSCSLDRTASLSLPGINYSRSSCPVGRVTLKIAFVADPREPHDLSCKSFKAIQSPRQGHSEIALVADPGECGHATQAHLGVSLHPSLNKESYLLREKKYMLSLIHI